MLDQSLRERGWTRSGEGGEMQRRVSIFVEGVWIGTDHQQGFHELWKWKLTDGVAADQGGFPVAGQMEGGSSSFHDCLKKQTISVASSESQHSRLTFNLTKS